MIYVKIEKLYTCAKKAKTDKSNIFSIYMYTVTRFKNKLTIILLTLFVGNLLLWPWMNMRTTMNKIWEHTRIVEDNEQGNRLTDKKTRLFLNPLTLATFTENSNRKPWLTRRVKIMLNIYRIHIKSSGTVITHKMGICY